MHDPVGHDRVLYVAFRTQQNNPVIILVIMAQVSMPAK